MLTLENVDTLVNYRIIFITLAHGCIGQSLDPSPFPLTYVCQSVLRVTRKVMCWDTLLAEVSFVCFSNILFKIRLQRICNKQS
jgi:hypothetical protein